MATKSELDKVRKDFEKEKDCLDTSKLSEDIYKNIFKAGLASLAYLGIRQLIGPEIEFGNEQNSFDNAWQFFDFLGGLGTYLCGGIGGLSYLISYAGRRSSEKDFNKAKSELETLTEDYKFSRGHI